MGAGEAIRMAYGKRGRIVLWSLIAALVGTLIAEIANRLPGGARLIGWFLGAAWGLATIFVIPILAMEGIGPVDALKRSAGLVKSRWGEGITGRVSIGAWSVVAMVPLGIVIGVGAALLRRHPETGVVLIGLGTVGLIAVFTAVAATQQVFAVALYRYAIDAPIGGFSSSDLDYPFTPAQTRKKRKSWILRIGGVILCFLVLLIVIGLIVGPRHHTGAEGYFHIDYAPAGGRRLERWIPRCLPSPTGGQRPQHRNRRSRGEGWNSVPTRSSATSSKRPPPTSTTSGAGLICESAASRRDRRLVPCSAPSSPRSGRSRCPRGP